MGIDDKVGSLKAGKRADLIMVSTRDVNLGVFGDPAIMLVTAAQPANVDTVMVDGRILKRGGKLTAMNIGQIVAEAAAANAALRKRANWWCDDSRCRPAVSPPKIARTMKIVRVAATPLNIPLQISLPGIERKSSLEGCFVEVGNRYRHCRPRLGGDYPRNRDRGDRERCHRAGDQGR